MIKVVVEESLNLSDEGKHCEDDLVNEDVKVEVKEVDGMKDDNVNDEDCDDILDVDVDDLAKVEVDDDVRGSGGCECRS